MSGEIVEVALRDPFPGPRPLQAEDKLFGRDGELLQLHDLLVAHRIVLLYSPSGAGKSSLLEAGLRPMLEEERFHVVGPLRVGQAVGDHDPQLGNPYLSSVVASLPSSAPADSAAGTADGLKERLRALETAVEGKPLVLVFDQFEELLTTTVGDDLAVVDRIRAEFLQEIGDALRDKSRWAVFAMREDYIAALDPFLHLMPTQLSTRFRIDLLRHDQALEAVKGPVSDLRPFQDDAAEALVTDLRMVRMPQRGGGFAIAPGRFVEPLHLQLVCRRLWVDTSGQTEIRVEDVRRGGAEPSGGGGGKDGRPDLSSVERALSDYYAEQVRAIGKEHRVDEGRLRGWFDRQLIVGDHRGRTLEGPLGATPPDDPLLEGIVDSHLVRTSKSADAVWYELAHDRLIEPVTRSNRDWRWQHGGRFRRFAAVGGIAVLAVAAISFLVLSELRSQDLSDRNRNISNANQALENLTTVAVRRRSSAAGIASGFRGHAGPVNAVAFGPDGTLASGGADGMVILWDVASRQQLNVLQGHKGPVNAIAFGSDLTTLASGGVDGTVILWVVSNPEQGGESLAEHAGPVNAVAFGRDVTTLASGGADGSVILWDVSNSEQGGESLGGHAGPVYAVAFDPDGRTLASGGVDGTVRLWDLASRGGAADALEEDGGAIRSVAIGPDGRTLASGAADGRVRLWDLTSRELSGAPLTGHEGPVYTVAIDPDGGTLASGGADGTIRLWDLTSREPSGAPLTGHEGPVYTVAIDPGGGTLASGGADGTIRLWDVNAD
jgi:WD40 repeat protein